MFNTTLCYLENDRPAFLLKLEYQGDRLVRAVLDGRELSLEEHTDKF